MPNPVVHFEIIGTDAASLQAFYRNLFGWTVNADNPMKYGIVDTATPGRGIGGGIGGAMGGTGSRVTIYIEVPDINASLARITDAGGKVLLPRSAVPGGPTLALFADPAGNCVGLMDLANAR
jgi:predicted enzyme related to lactoylglutathione lyase